MNREASPALPAATTSPTNNPEQFNARAKRPDAASSSHDAAHASSAPDTPPWEDAPWEVSSETAPQPLKLVPPPAPENNNRPPAAPQPSGSAPRDAADTSSTTMTFGASQGGILEQLKTKLEERRKPLLAIALESARKVSVEGEELYVEFAPESKHLRDNLSKPEGIKSLREVCALVCGREMGIRIVVKDKHEAEDDAPPSPHAPMSTEQEEKRRLRELAENHPSVQQVLRAFQAEIVDVRRVESPTVRSEQ